jgi:hypothetical protein
MGKTKLAVFFDPVLAISNTSFPFFMAGIASC